MRYNIYNSIIVLLMIYNIYYSRSFFNSDHVPTLFSALDQVLDLCCASGPVTNLCNPSDPVLYLGGSKGRMSLIERIAVIQGHQSRANVCQ